MRRNARQSHPRRRRYLTGVLLVVLHVQVHALQRRQTGGGGGWRGNCAVKSTPPHPAAAAHLVEVGLGRQGGQVIVQRRELGHCNHTEGGARGQRRLGGDGGVVGRPVGDDLRRTTGRRERGEAVDRRNWLGVPGRAVRQQRRVGRAGRWGRTVLQPRRLVRRVEHRSDRAMMWRQRTSRISPPPARPTATHLTDGGVLVAVRAVPVLAALADGRIVIVGGDDALVHLVPAPRHDGGVGAGGVMHADSARTRRRWRRW
jgi:hypothetical protein